MNCEQQQLQYPGAKRGVRALLAPRDWQAIALREAAELSGTPEGAAKLAESRRYGALADELDRLRADAARWRWLAGDVDGDAQDDFIQWLHGAIAPRQEVDAECDRHMAPDYLSPQG